MKSHSPRQPAMFPILGLAAALLIGSVFCFVRRTDFFVRHAELPAYDLATRMVWPWKCGHPDVALITIQDHSLGWPLADGTLADALERIAAADPCAIGIDLIRDRAVDGGTNGGAERLAKVGMDDRIVWVEIEPGDGKSGVLPPPFIRELDDEALKGRKLASATFPVDSGTNGIVRRGRVAVWSDDCQRLSLAAMLAWRHREKHPMQGGEDPLARLFEDIGSLVPTAGGYWFDEFGNSCEFLLKPVSGAALRFRKVALGEAADDDIPVYSLAEIMDGNTDQQSIREALRGKIILFGTHDDSTAKDEIAVVGDPLLRGVKLHALATGQLMRELEGEAPIGYLSDRTEDALVVLTGLLALGCLLLRRLPLLGRGIAAVAVVPILAFTGGLLGLKFGWWIPTAGPMAAGSVSGLCGLVLVWANTSRERRTYLAVMNSHLGPEVTARVLERNSRMVAGMKRSPESFMATALFGDLLGYSAASQHFQEHGTPADFFAWLNGYLGPAVDITGRHGGFIKQFVGDGIFVIFGFPPESGRGHAQRAVDCACELARLVPILNRGLPDGVPRYYLRIGIYTGEIHASAVGGGRQADYSFLGPTINKASRLESIDKDRFDHERYPARILISDPTRAQLDESSPVLPYRDGPIILDKRLPPERVWEILPENSPQSDPTGVSFNRSSGSHPTSTPKSQGP